jgi:hypothetical protein
MEIEDVLAVDESAIVAEASRAVEHLEHYRRDGAAETHRRLEALYQRVLVAIRARDVTDLTAYAAAIARERRQAGFELPEVQAAFAALEDAIERHAMAQLPAYDQAWGLGLACTAFAHARRALELPYGRCGTRAPVADFDLTQLFAGTGPAAGPIEAVH